MPSHQQLSLLQENANALKDELANQIVPSSDIVSQMEAMGFHKGMIEMALKTVANNMDSAVEMLLRIQSDGKYDDTLKKIMDLVSTEVGPSTSSSQPHQKLAATLQKQKEIDEVCV